MTYVIRDFDVNNRNHCQRLADMFNDWDSSWPGGFTRGAKETVSQVEEEHRRSRHLAVLAVESDEEFVGYCNLEAQPGQKELAYIGLLGARLSAHGKGVGKLLLREMVRRVTDMGYKQVTLHTWGGNTKAVPLYKKTGFQWIPETDVFMRNFLPAILNMPIVKTFLDGRDWYECMEREIVVAPDNVTWNGMKVYPYFFRNGERTLKLTFDAAGEGLTALETEDYAFSCTIPVEEAPAGQNYHVKWEMETKKAGALNVVLLAEAEKGLALRVQEHVRVEGVQSLQREVRIDNDVTPRRDNEAAHRIKTTLLIDGQPLILETGVKIVRPIEIEYGGQKLIPGREEKITVRLHSNLERELAGTLALNARTELHCADSIQQFTLPAKGWTQCEFMLTAVGTGVYETSLSLIAEELCLERLITFRAFNANEVLGSIDPIEEIITLESQATRVQANLRGGRLSIEAGQSMRDCLRVEMGRLGPPFVGEQLIPPLYEAQIENTTSGNALILSGRPEVMPGLKVEQIVSLPGGGLIKFNYRVYNLTDKPIATKMRFRAESKLDGQLIIPLEAGLLRVPMQGLQEQTFNQYDLLAQGAALAESWIATEEDGHVSGLIFTGNLKQDRQWTSLLNLIYDMETIPPYGVCELPPIYGVAGNGSWETVRGWWRKLVQPSGVYESHTLEPQDVLEIKIRPALLVAEEQSAELMVTHRRSSKLTGKLRLTGEGISCPLEFDVDGVNRDNGFRATVPTKMSAQCGAHFITAHFDANPVAETRRIGIVKLGTSGKVSVTASGSLDMAANSTANDVDHIDVNNDNLCFRVVPSYLGAVVSLALKGEKESGEVNQLRASYPTPIPFIWANPWYGGIHPMLGWAGDSRLTREKFTGERTSCTGELGIVWEGVRVTCRPLHKTLNWMRLETEYLTTAGSNVIALITRCTNLSTAQMETPGDIGVAAWLQVGGTHKNAIVHAEFNGTRQARRRGGFGMDSMSGTWKAVENAETGQTVLMIATAAKGKAGLEDFAEEGAHLSVQSACQLQPGETKETLGWLVMTDSPASIEAYVSGLAAIRRLP